MTATTETRGSLRRKMAELNIVRALPTSMWQRSLQIAEIPEDVISAVSRSRRMTAATQYLNTRLSQCRVSDRPAPRPAIAPLTPRRRTVRRVTPRSAPQEPPLSLPTPTDGLTRAFGVELECVGARRQDIVAMAQERGLTVMSESYNHHDRAYTKIVTDSSLHGTDCNEVVTPPLGAWDTLRAICEAISAAGGGVNASCGLHVHVDAHGFTRQQWQNIGHNYWMLSNIINSSLAPSRRRNHFCRVVDIPDSPAMSREALRLWSRGRYCAVNYEAWRRHKTIEFRQHQGSLNFNKIRDWVLFLESLVEWSQDHCITGEPVGRKDDPRLEGLRVDLLREMGPRE